VDTGQLEGCICVHALAETYSVLTKIPSGMTAYDALAVIHRLMTIFKVNASGSTHYVYAIERCASRALKSGAVLPCILLMQNRWGRKRYSRSIRPTSCD